MRGVIYLKKHLVKLRIIPYFIAIFLITILIQPNLIANEFIKNQNQFLYENTLYVGGSGPGNYSTIQGAINAASDGDTIFVYDDSSPYNEQLLIQKSINLIGENKETTIISHNSYLIIDIDTHNFTFQGFTVSGGGIGIAGIFSDSVICETVIDVIIAGIIVGYSQRNKFFNNTITTMEGYESSVAIDLYKSHNNEIYNNIIKFGDHGLSLWTSQHNKIYQNSISSFNIGLNLYWCFQNRFFKNTFLNNTNHLYFDNCSYNVLYRNYWDDWSNPLFRLFSGLRYCPFLNKTISGFMIDWFPALTPF